tara:strand:- start:1721 stop:2269 length:549 start_codon:yes stop_codon:yes gene_type:complete
MVFPSLVHATDTVTSSTVSSTVSSSSNTVSTSSGNTVVDKTPSTASSPSVVVNNSDVCVTGVSAALQTGFLGLSGGKTIRDKNCERLKLARSLYGMGLKVAGVSLLCQDKRVFDAMMAAGTPCPYDGQIGDKAKKAWLENPGKAPEGTRLVIEAEKLAALKAEKLVEAENNETEDEDSDTTP